MDKDTTTIIIKALKEQIKALENKVIYLEGRLDQIKFQEIGTIKPGISGEPIGGQFLQYEFVPKKKSQSEMCGCNPANGGSGICGCTLGSETTITC